MTLNLHEHGERNLLGRANWVKDPPELCLLPASSMARTNFQVPHVPHLQFHILCLCSSEHEVYPDGSFDIRRQSGSQQ